MPSQDRWAADLQRPGETIAKDQSTGEPLPRCSWIGSAANHDDGRQKNTSDNTEHVNFCWRTNAYGYTEEQTYQQEKDVTGSPHVSLRQQPNFPTRTGPAQSHVLCCSLLTQRPSVVDGLCLTSEPGQTQ